MGLPEIKIGPIWRCAILLALLFLLYGCATYSANIKEGSFDVNPPKPFWGPGTYIFPDEFYIRGTMSYSIEDKETFSLEKYEKEKSDKKKTKNNNINYVLQKNPFSGSVEFFCKKEIYDGGARLAIEPYPSVILFAGINALYGEFGFGLRIGYSKDDASYSGDYFYESPNGAEDDNGKFQEEHSYHNANYGIYMFSSIFVTEILSLNFSTGLYQPWLYRRSLYLENVNYPEDYDISIDFPFLLSQYVGVTLFLLDHIQLSTGETVFYSSYIEPIHWQTNISISYLF
ncbi:hypothetical protein [uncultured Fibrobacter sp.]|uniref:hypothetical protein n=1 Tax=uncultured Fibrobacter sp. TaxID=261512 RepID=UPI0025E11095|nr:hypothetical protein [uncultured Fibrobacter sp.]